MQRTFERTLVEQCAPTLAGIQCANLFHYHGRADGLRHAAHWDKKLSPLGIRVLVLKACPKQDACVVYVFRPAQLELQLSDQANRDFLAGRGYPTTTMEDSLSHLSRQLCLEQDYPHEIGVFLGYPLEDVVGFIENAGRNYTCAGRWKCYGDPDAARRCFARCRQCTDAYTQLHIQGVPVTDLVLPA